MRWTLHDSREPARAKRTGSAALRFGAAGRPALARIAADPWFPPARARRRSRPATPPDAAARRILENSVSTPAGRYFAPLAATAPGGPSAPDSVFVVHVVPGTGGFQVAGRPTPPRLLAAAIRACPEWRHRPVLLLSPGRVPTAALLGSLAAALGVGVVSCDGGAYVGPRTVLTDGSLERWNPPGRRYPGGPRTVRLGAVLPIPVAGRPPEVVPTRESEPPGTAAPEEPPVPVDWVRVPASAGSEDHEGLRSLLGSWYDLHARAVENLGPYLPRQPAAGGEDQAAGLIAVRAVLSAAGDGVAAMLRGEEEPASWPDAGAARFLARCGRSGLRWLPAVTGPVYRPVVCAPGLLSAYRPGDELVEPAFTEAWLHRDTGPDSTVEYVIWSFTGRRTDRLLGEEDAPRVLFDAGSRFVVLDVEAPSRPGDVARVLLRELAGRSGSHGAVDDRVLRRLRAPVAPAGARPAPSRGLTWHRAVGVRDDATAFEPDGPPGP